MTASPATIRSEGAADCPAVRAVNLAAFPTAAEANLVDALRLELDACISLVAEVDSEIVGHILFTPAQVHPERDRPWNAIALGPMAVVPAHQRCGIGTALVRAGLEQCRAHGHNVVCVLGHPGFYPRFGFKPARPHGILCVWNVPDDVFMVAELAPGALAGRTGLVRYHALFDGE